MPTIEENRFLWDVAYDWKREGDEWSLAWGGTDMQWYSTILPRIHAFVPAGTILEIAPGFGRWTQFLKDLCGRLILVDLSEKCIQTCKERFGSCSHVTYYVNDGKSLDMIADEAIDFVFSFDSLVHAEDDVIEAYINQLARKLKKDGVGFIHHSNLGEYSDCFSLIRDHHWRASSMTAGRFKQYAEEAGLQCISQEIINWGGTEYLIDCITVFTRNGSTWARPNRVVRNGDFMREVEYASTLSQLYGVTSFYDLEKSG